MHGWRYQEISSNIVTAISLVSDKILIALYIEPVLKYHDTCRTFKVSSDFCSQIITSHSFRNNVSFSRKSTLHSMAVHHQGILLCFFLFLPPCVSTQCYMVSRTIMRSCSFYSTTHLRPTHQIGHWHWYWHVLQI